MRFTDFLKATVLTSAAAASAMGAVAVVGASAQSSFSLVAFAAGWWLLAAAYGLWLGRQHQTTTAIARLLASARNSPTLPELQPGRMLLNRLWPLLACTVAAGALAFLEPQVPAIAAGFAIIAALGWRRQEAAVTAIEERDGVRFYIERTSPLKPIQLVRTPGFKAMHFQPNGTRVGTRR